MKTKIVTVATRPDPGLTMLIESMEKFGLDYVVLGQDQQWKGFGTKIILLEKYLKSIDPEYTHVVFVDAYDVALLSGMDEIEKQYTDSWPGKIVFSAELNCWPCAELSERYPACDSLWRYLNSGSYMAPISGLLSLFSAYPPVFEMDDQLYFTKMLLGGESPIVLDTNCSLFQTTAFCYNNEYRADGARLVNNLTGTMPVVIHGNGRTPMDSIYELLKHN